MSRGTDTFSKMTPEERAEYGRQGGIKSGESKRRKKAMKETLEVLLSMPLKKGKVANVDDIKNFGDLNGKNVDVQTAILMKALSSYMKTGDLSILGFIRDTVGDKPTDQMSITGAVPVVLKDDVNE